MGQNSTEVAYGFGQFGSAFADTTDNIITPPTGLAIVAIQFLGNSTLARLVATDANRFPNTAGAAHDLGLYTRTINGGLGSSDQPIFDEENTGTSTNNSILVGDVIYDSTTGVEKGTVTALNPDGDNTKEILVNGNTSWVDDRVYAFLRPSQENADGQGVGGQTIDSSQVFPKGMTIYGRWKEIKLAATDADGGIICYFGK